MAGYKFLAQEINL